MAGRKSSASNIKMQSVDALFGLEQDKGSPAEKVEEVAIDKLYPFNSHPFKVLDDEKMQETVESVREHGIICPLLAPMIKCKKTPKKKCRFMAERKKKR